MKPTISEAQYWIMTQCWLHPQYLYVLIGDVLEYFYYMNDNEKLAQEISYEAVIGLVGKGYLEVLSHDKLLERHKWEELLMNPSEWFFYTPRENELSLSITKKGEAAYQAGEFPRPEKHPDNWMDVPSKGKKR